MGEDRTFWLWPVTMAILSPPLSLTSLSLSLSLFLSLSLSLSLSLVWIVTMAINAIIKEIDI